VTSTSALEPEKRTHHGALVGDANADALTERTVGEQLAQRIGERLDVDDLALANRVCLERTSRCPFGENRPVDPRLDRGHEARLDVEPDEPIARARAGAARELQ